MPPTGSLGQKPEHGNLFCLPVTETGSPRRPEMGKVRGGASVVVGAWESHVQGEGKQGTDEAELTEERSVDTDYQTDLAWLLGVQCKLYQWSKRHPDDAWRDLWNWFTDPRNLRCAWQRIATNTGKRSAGIDGLTVNKIRMETGEDRFLEELRTQLRSSSYCPSPAKRRLIPKLGQPGKFRPLGIPTVADRVVQAAIKNLLEPIFEAQFWHVSYGFRPGRSCHGALEHIRMTMRPRKRSTNGRRDTPPYRWVIEGDIKSCFDHIDHHHLMVRLRARVADRKMTRLILRFLKAGILAEDQFLRTDAGTPQGGVLSPLLANIALSAIEERYERWVCHRHKTQSRRTSDGVTAAMETRSTDRRAGRVVFFPIRYADDFVILVSGSCEQAEAERQALAAYLKETTGLDLSPEKTKVTALTEGFEFLGHRVRLVWDRRYGYSPRVEIPKNKAANLRYKVKQLTCRSTIPWSLAQLLRELNPILRGWGHFYRYCTGAGDVFASLDWYVSDRIWRWRRKKLPKARQSEIALARLPSRVRPTWRVWQADDQEQYLLSWLPVRRYRRGWMRTPAFAAVPGEPDA